MSQLSNYLVEEILHEGTGLKPIVVYSGRFQPMHPGHFGVYKHLVKKFGADNVWIGTSNKTEAGRSPFNFKEKKKIMTTIYGIPSSKIVEVKSPYSPKEILNKFDPDKISYVAVVGDKEVDRLSSKYYNKLGNNDIPDIPYSEKAYVYVVPAKESGISATVVRNNLSNGSDEDKLNYFKKVFPKFDKGIFDLIISKLDEGYEIKKEELIDWLIKEGSNLLTLGGSEVDDGPAFLYPTYNTYKRVSTKMANKLGMTVVDMILRDDLEDVKIDTNYPKGPVGSVSFFPSGITGNDNPRNQVNIYSGGAFSKWYMHINKVATMVGYSLVDSTMGKSNFKSSQLTENFREKFHTELNKKIREDVTIPVKIGDTILTGKFKNKKTVVKSIGKDEHGMPTINGRKVVTFRILKEGYWVELDQVKGGKADKLTISDIAKKHNVSVEQIKAQVIKGIKVELEHTDDKQLAMEITLDHLVEMPDYYDKLQTIDPHESYNKKKIGEMSKSQLKQVEKFADAKLSPTDVAFTKHFFDRLNDPRNGKEISQAELVGFFKRLVKHKSELINFLNKYNQFVLNDKRTDINIPMVKSVNSIIAKTVMRKQDFQTSNPKLKFEDAAVFNPDIVSKKKVWYKLDTNDILKVSDNVIELIKTAYKGTDMGSFVNSKSDLTKSIYWNAIDIDSNPNANAVIFGRKSPHGIKIQGIGHDGEKISKDVLINRIVKLLNTNGYWIEASGALERVLSKKGVPFVNSEKVAQSIFPNSGLKFLGHGGQYKRKVDGGKEVIETIFGKPKVSVRESLNEASGKPKVVIMAGGAAAGKSYVLNQLGLDKLPQFNPDKYVEDPDHPYYNNLSAASSQTTKDVEYAISQKQSFVWDTTASNPQKVKDLLSAGYDVFMVMVYTHPIISFIGNFERERNIPKSAVFRTWDSVYSLVRDYKSMLGNNLVIKVSDRGGKYQQEVEEFNKYAKKGATGVADYLEKYMDEHGGHEKFSSTSENQ